VKKQTGIWIDSRIWEQYRRLCSNEKLRPSESIEEFLKLVLRTGSPSTVLDMMKAMEKSRVEGIEAYARMLLDWYTHEKFWIDIEDEKQRSTEQLLLEAIKKRARSAVEAADRRGTSGRRTPRTRRRHALTRTRAQRRRGTRA